MSDGKKDNAPKTTGLSIENLLKMLAASSVADENAPPKSMEEYKFWKTQPVVKFDQEVDVEGPIENKTVDQVPKEPYPLRDDFEWATIDITDPAQLQEVYELLYNNYIEDDDATFRFKYSPAFLSWGMKCPGFNPEWSVGVRVKETKKLVGFISGIPAKLRVRDNIVQTAEINFLNVHKKLRSKRLAPLLIREVTRRINLTGVWQALYTAGAILPSPISTCRYYHRSLDWPKLYEVGFSPLPIGSTPAKQVAKYALPAKPTLDSLRRMTKADVPQVKKLLDKYLGRFDISPVYTEEDLEHWLVNSSSKDEKEVVYAYVVEKDGQITDLVSFYILESTVLGNAKYDSIKVAYAFYYATDVAFNLEEGDSKPLKNRLQTLFQNALIFAKNLECDVFNALSLQDNALFLDDLKFGPGDGYLHYYLFNYRAFPIYGGLNETKEATFKPNQGVGVVML
uniref:Glycylpeptide N-tetradecanoyltransferase n=1 Tax=Blastobotrys adeninivorans TaxID=409370 RepID=A0A060T9G1_BLAAD